MKTSFRRSLILMALLVLFLIAARSQSAQATRVTTGNATLVNALTFNTKGAATGQVSVLIELWAPAVAQVYAATAASAAVQSAQMAATTQAHLATVEAAQQRLLTTLQTLDAQILYRNQRVYNGIALRIAADQVATLQQLPGVKAVHALTPKYLDADPMSLRNIASLWQLSKVANALPTSVLGAGELGEGIKIAVIDTGIDYLHTDFGGPGVGYAANDLTVIGDVTGFPGAKVVDGYDFAGNTYNADPNDLDFQPIPTPDADPMDCYGHGTHVAGIAAGYGVQLDGSTYPGPYPTVLESTDFKVPPGVAPAASLYALKVFGCSGGSEIVDRAIEWAVDPNGDGDFADHVDVINLSLGSPYGSVEDPTAVASQNAAAVGVIVVASAGNSSDVYYITGSPAVADGVISVAAGQTVVVPAGTGPTDSFETIALFSARGPRRLDSALKPDLTAPGFKIVSAGYGTGSNGSTLSGTSMAAPHVAGIMALLRQQRPTWTVAELKALVINTAEPSLRTAAATAQMYSPARVGAGLIDLARARQVNELAYNAEKPELVSLSFGAPEVVTQSLALKEVQIANKSAAMVTYTVAYQSITDMAGVAFQWPTQPISVAAGSLTNFPVFLTADPTQMQRARDATVSVTQGGQPRQWLSEETGYLLLQPISSTVTSTLRVPIYAAPRPAATLQAIPAALDFGTQLQATQALTFTGIGLQGSQFPTDIVPIVSAVELHFSSPNLAPAQGETQPGESQAELYDHADLKYGGVTSDFAATQTVTNPSGSVSASTIFFGVATHSNWSTPNEVKFQIYIDTDGDGSDDFMLFNADQVGYNLDNAASDTFITALKNLDTGSVSAQLPLNNRWATDFDTAPYNSNVMLLPVSAAALGLTATNPSFDYAIESYSNDRLPTEERIELYVDRSPRLHFNLTTAGLDLSGGKLGSAQIQVSANTAVSVTFDLAAYALSDAQGILLLHHHNRSTLRDQVVPLLYQWPHAVYAPLIMDGDQ